MTLEDDARLVEAIGRGDASALERAYGAHKDALLTVSSNLLGDRAAGEDVLHDVFVSLARAAPTIRLRDSLRRYLVASCVHRVRDVLRRRQRVAAAPDPLEDLESFAPDPGARLEQNDGAARLASALAALPPAQRAVVTLHLHGDLTFREIAELLSIPMNTAQSRYRYALDALRKALAEEGARG